MNGFWQKTGDIYNMTLFYLDSNKGVTAYSYQAGKEDLLSMGIPEPTPGSSP
jgi:hypothetical protein